MSKYWNNVESETGLKFLIENSILKMVIDGIKEWIALWYRRISSRP